MTAPSPEDRERARDLVQSQWREPVTVVYLTEVRPEFRIPGRRYDGTFKGKRLVRRFFYNLVRGIINVPVSLFLSAGAGQVAIFNFPTYDATVEGPADAQALQLVTAAMSAGTAWLAFTETRVAIVKDGQILWYSEVPQHNLRKHQLSWPDGSTYTYAVKGADAETLLALHKRKLYGESDSR
jgi:hypothetical protein